MDDMDEKYLLELEQRLAEAEKERKNDNLDGRIAQLSKTFDEQKKWIHDYEDEVNKLQSDVANIAKIRESLPDGCYRRMRLEPWNIVSFCRAQSYSVDNSLSLNIIDDTKTLKRFTGKS